MNRNSTVVSYADVTKLQIVFCSNSKAYIAFLRFLMSATEYRLLLFDISEKIDWQAERKRLLYIFKSVLPKDSETNIQDVISLFTSLEEKNLLGIDRVEALKDLLKGIAEWDLHKKVKTFETKRREYRSLLLLFSRELDECNKLQRLISVCEGKIAPDREEEIKDVFTLLTELEKHNNLGFGRLDVLKMMAVNMEKPGLVKQVEVFEGRRNDEEFGERANHQREQFWRKVREGKTLANLY